LIGVGGAIAQRIKKEARYEHMVRGGLRRGGDTLDVAVLSREPVAVQEAISNNAACVMVVDQADALVSVAGDHAAGRYQLVMWFDGDVPAVLLGGLEEDLDDYDVARALNVAGIIDAEAATRGGSGNPEVRRTDGILVKGLRVYGYGKYSDERGAEVRWVRVGQ
jgi:hypothetical protein